MDAKVKAIIAHFTLIGWIIALVINSNQRDEYTSFYLRQTIGIHVIGMLLGMVPVVGWILAIVLFAFWLLSLIYAVQGDMKVIPFGEYFQDWFRGL
ncbi:hypothetical protein [Roseimarinus sediminis]|uniref:hypothetical protein n=1 Tax=Roseimarinus sediminis TaxID=1610899 RepID=UPI003D2261C0